MADLTISVSDGERTVTLTADWADDAPRTRAALAEALPVEGRAARWGDELYFDVPLAVDGENPRTEVEVGTVAYWPAGSKLCLFWGPTPASTGEKPRAASPVTVVARMTAVSDLERIEGDADVRVASV